MRKISLLIIIVLFATLMCTTLLTACNKEGEEKGQTDLTATDFKSYFDNSKSHFEDLSKPIQISYSVKSSNDDEESEDYEYNASIKYYDKLYLSEIGKGEDVKKSYTVYDYENKTITTYSYDKDEEKWFKTVVDKSEDDVTENELRDKYRAEVEQFSSFITLKDSFDMFELKDDKYYIKEDKLSQANTLIWGENEIALELSELWVKFNSDKIAEIGCKYGNDEESASYFIKFSYDNTVITLPEEAVEAEED